MAGISDKSIKTNYFENKYKYNGKEKQDKEFSDGIGLEMYDYGHRMQDPQLGRFWQQDAFSEKYYGFSPYQYAANNPAKNIDINGDTVWTTIVIKNADGTTTSSKYYWAHDKDYEGWHDSKGNQTTSQNDFMRQVNAALAFINLTKEGSETLADLTTSKNTFNIVNTSGLNQTSASGTNAYYAQFKVDPKTEGTLTGKGSGATITWNPSGDPNGGVYVLGKKQDNNPITNLAHEIFHADDANQGIYWDDKYASGKDRDLSKDEWQASYRENIYRQQLHLPLREFYRRGVDEDRNPTGGQPPRLLDSKNNQPIRPSWVPSTWPVMQKP